MERARLIVGLLVASMAVLPASGDPPPRELASLEFMVGAWVGLMDGGEIEEIWTAPSGDNMMGMFRWTKDGHGVFYEFQTIERTPDGPRLNVRHFYPSLIGWEAKEEALRLPLALLEPGRAIFGEAGTETRLEYRLTADGRLKITLHKIEGNKMRTTEFFYKRQ